MRNKKFSGMAPRSSFESIKYRNPSVISYVVVATFVLLFVYLVINPGSLALTARLFGFLINV